MYSLTSANRYYLYLGFVRMNLGIDGLFKIIRSQMKELSPISGDVFLFFGKNRQSVKILRWDGDGMEIWDSRAIENTKCQNDKIIFIFCRYQPQKYFPIFFLFSFFIVKFAIEARKCP